MPLSIKPTHVQRYKDMAVLLAKYWSAEFASEIGLGEYVWQGNGKSHSHEGQKPDFLGNGNTKEDDFVADIRKLGPTFIVLANLLAHRPDLVPKPYIDWLGQLTSDNEPMSPELVQSIFTRTFQQPPEKIFANFESKPFQVTALGQLHDATGRDGKRLVVKIQRDGLKPTIAEDLEALRELADYVGGHTKIGKKYDLARMVASLSQLLSNELDFGQELRSLKAGRECLKEFEHLEVPACVDCFCSAEILTTIKIDGQKMDGVLASGFLNSEKIRLAEQLHAAFCKELLVDGFVHVSSGSKEALLTKQGKIALLNFGIVAHLSPRLREKLLRLVIAITEGKPEPAIELVTTIGERHGTVDLVGLHLGIEKTVLAFRDHEANPEAGKAILTIAKICTDHSLVLPPEIVMAGTALSNLNRLVSALEIKFDGNGFIHKQASELLRSHVFDTLAPSNLFKGALQAAELMEEFPSKVGRILDSVANNDLKITVHAIDEQVLINGFQKIANRVAMALVLASLIVGAAMLMRVPTTFTIFGYPGLAMVLFIAAAGCGFTLVVEILIGDRRQGTP